MSGQPYYADASVTLWHGDCREVMRDLPDASVDAIVTDPPYGLGFMGRAWDDLPPGLPWARECLRVLKPGGHLLAFGGTRTWHRLACAVEDARFEIRDSIAWLYGSGFPKSRDVSKAIDKAAGATREAGEPYIHPRDGVPYVGPEQAEGVGSSFKSGVRAPLITAPATPAAARWQGWGTALKPSFEPIVVGRKPLIGTVEANVLAHGTGALNVDGCRVEHNEPAGKPQRGMSGRNGAGYGPGGTPTYRERETDAASTAGRWPTNVILDDSQAAELDRQSGVLSTHGDKPAGHKRDDVTDWRFRGGAQTGDSGGASRFFPTFRYEAKAAASERPTYQRDGEVTSWGGIRTRCTICGRQEVNVSGACDCPEPDFQPDPAMAGKVAHPTVKPLGLMRWLVRLVTPPGGLVLDPFAGSGTTAEACVVEGFRCVLIEREPDYLPLIVQRLTKPIAPVLDFGDGAA